MKEAAQRVATELLPPFVEMKEAAHRTASTLCRDERSSTKGGNRTASIQFSSCCYLPAVSPGGLRWRFFFFGRDGWLISLRFVFGAWGGSSVQ